MMDHSESSDRYMVRTSNSEEETRDLQTLGPGSAGLASAADPFMGHSEFHMLLRQHDWADSALGSPDSWPQSLKTIVRLMLASPFPMFIGWGPQYSMLYNAAYVQILGARHPAALGRPALEVWPEIHDWLLTSFAKTLAGETVYHENPPFTLLRNGYPEKTWFTFSYSPLQDNEGCNAGVFCIINETTTQTLAQQQQQFSTRLAESLRAPTDIEQLLARSSELLGRALGASRVVFGEHDPRLKTTTWFPHYTEGPEDSWTDAEPATLFELGHFAPVERGETWIADNLATDPRSGGPENWPTFEALRLHAVVTVPLRRHGALMPFLLVSQAHARHWSCAEIALIKDTAERSWNAVQRLRAEAALRQLDEDFKAQLIAERDRLQQLFSHAPGFVAFVRGPEHVFEAANQAYYQLVGHRPLIGRPVAEAVPEAEAQGYIELLDQVYTSKAPFVGREMKVRLQPNPNDPVSDAYVDFVMQPLLEADGTIAGIFMQGYDVTAYKRTREEAHIANERWQLAIESTGDGVWDWNVDPAKSMGSARLKEILGFAATDTELDHYENWEHRIHPKDVARVKDSLKACLSGSITSFRVDYRFRCKNGDWKWVESRGMVVERDTSGRAVRAIGMLADISEQKEVESQQWQHANFDTLTGLPNRRLFRDRLDQSVKKARRDHHGLALFFIDLDRFKEANDLLGHDAGDLLLIEAGRRITASVRASDTVARLGGDEFTVILNDWEEEAHIELAAQKIIHALAQPFHVGEEMVYLSASVGITLYSKDANSSSELVKNADQAMYVAKNAGRNRFSYFTREMQEAADLRFRLSSDLRDALQQQQLEVFYQPVIDLATGRIAKAEALLRWRHPKWGMIEPAQFIPLAEETGQITKIGIWVFEQAAACSQRWGALLGETFQVAVNKSPTQFMTWHDEGSWITHLHSLGLEGASLAIEITEGLLLNASAMVREKLTRYRAAGVQIGLDDFGTGYSSLAYLKKFDLDYLKIDQTFISGIPSYEEDQAVAESIILMARRLGMKVVAEGIETTAQNILLTAAGCDYGQGFLFSKAVPADEFERLLRADRLPS